MRAVPLVATVLVDIIPKSMVSQEAVEMNLTDKQLDYYTKLTDNQSKAEFLQLLKDALGPLQTTVADLTVERQSQTTASTLTISCHGAVSCHDTLGENKGGLFYQTVFRKFKFISQEMEVFHSPFCTAVFDWKKEEETAERWVKLRKMGMTAVSDARTQLQNRVKEYFISKCDRNMMATDDSGKLKANIGQSAGNSIS
jgi:hypothetical protein